jgi:hypothetical protein
MANLRVSVVIPTYNRASLLALLGQLIWVFGQDQALGGLQVQARKPLKNREIRKKVPR